MAAVKTHVCHVLAICNVEKCLTHVGFLFKFRKLSDLSLYKYFMNCWKISKYLPIAKITWSHFKTQSHCLNNYLFFISINNGRIELVATQIWKLHAFEVPAPTWQNKTEHGAGLTIKGVSINQWENSVFDSQPIKCLEVDFAKIPGTNMIRNTWLCSWLHGRSVPVLYITVYSKCHDMMKFSNFQPDHVFCSVATNTNLLFEWQLSVNCLTLNQVWHKVPSKINHLVNCTYIRCLSNFLTLATCWPDRTWRKSTVLITSLWRHFRRTDEQNTKLVAYMLYNPFHLISSKVKLWTGYGTDFLWTFLGKERDSEPGLI